MAHRGFDRFTRFSEETDFDKVVIRGLRLTTGIGEIVRELDTLGFRVHDVRHAVDPTTKQPVPTLFLKLVKNPWNEYIFKVQNLVNQQVKVEKVREPLNVRRCTKCQGLGHCRQECTNSPICSYCSGAHLTRKCRFCRDTTPPTCCRCGGAHPANYMGCLVYKKQLLEIEKVKKYFTEQDGSLENIKPEAKEFLVEFEGASRSQLNFQPRVKCEETVLPKIEMTKILIEVITELSGFLYTFLIGRNWLDDGRTV